MPLELNECLNQYCKKHDEALDWLFIYFRTKHPTKKKIAKLYYFLYHEESKELAQRLNKLAIKHYG